jgi:hypothetical protein
MKVSELTPVERSLMYRLCGALSENEINDNSELSDALLTVLSKVQTMRSSLREIKDSLRSAL